MMTEHIRTEIEAATFRRLVSHLQSRRDVQNIDLMNLAGFCRNCMAKWYAAEAESRGVDPSLFEDRSQIYGMPYATWKARYQTPATPEQEAIFKAKGTP